jgi:hypothetical protein
MSDQTDSQASNNKFEGYDIIGDVHGCYDSLIELLTKLGYSLRDGVYVYSNQSKPRQVIFLGDILDRGPKIRESIHIVQTMVERGSAQIIMGNHEYNALGYTTLAPEGNGQKYLRDNNGRHTRAIQETLDQFANHPHDWADTVEWFYDWPMYLEFEYFRVIHACWDQVLIDQFALRFPNAKIDHSFLIESHDYQQFAGRFMSRTTRGVSLHLPDNHTMTGLDGYTRNTFRVKFWVQNPNSYGDIQFQPDPLANTIAKRQLNEDEKRYLPFYGRDQRPLFIGHYWQKGIPAPLVDNIACLDYSAVKNGKLVAYRMNKQQKLSGKGFAWVDGQERLV